TWVDDLSQLDFVVMSHRHGDHMGGLAMLLKLNPSVKIYAPREGFGVYGADLPGTFYRKDESILARQRYYDGNPPDVMRFGTAWPGANIELVAKNAEIAPGIHRSRWYPISQARSSCASSRSRSTRPTAW